MGWIVAYLVLLGAMFSVFMFLFGYMLKSKNSLSLSFALFSVANAIYALSIFGQLLSKNNDQALFFFNLKHYGALFITPLFTLFLYKFSNILRVNRKYSFVLFIIPVILLAFVTTNNYHSLMFKDLDVVVHHGFKFIDRTNGPLYFLIHLYKVMMFLLSLYFLYLISLRKNYSFKRFSLFFSVYLVLTIIFQTIHLTNLIPKGLDLTPLSSVAGLILFMLVFFYCDIFDVYELNFNMAPELNDGVIVTDRNNKVIFYNDITIKLLPWVNDGIIGNEFNSLPLKEFTLNNDVNSGFILENTHNDLTKYYIFKKVALEQKSKTSAYAYIFKDHTDNVYLQRRLEKLAAKDGLTKIYNQISILNKAKERYEKAKEDKTIFSVTLIDVDNFKSVNDNFGHIFGNSVLIEIADNIGEYFHGSCCSYGRFGGDEFLISCSNCDIAIQEEKMDKLLKSISKINYNELKDVDLSISAGTCYIDFSLDDEHPTYEESLEIADKKMYKAKEEKK